MPTSPTIGTAPASTTEYVRASDEYAVAFDLEIWKAQQQAKFRQQLRQAKEALEKKVLHELKIAFARKSEALETRRRELEAMATRVQAAGEALEKRSEQFQAREEAFEARRVRVAEQHELHLQRVESRAKQFSESLSAQLEAARAELSEKDGIIRDVRSKLLAAQNEYDGLLRKMTRLGADTAGTAGESPAAVTTTADPAALRTQVRALEAELGLSRQAIQEQKNQIAQQQREMDHLMRENAAQAVALRKGEIKIEELGRRCARVQDDYYAREREHLQMERDRLETQKREAQRLTRQRQLLGSDFHSAPSLAPSRSYAPHTAAHTISFSGSTSALQPGQRTDDGLRDMTQELRGDITRALTARSHGSQVAPSYVVAEHPSSFANTTHADPRRPASGGGGVSHTQRTSLHRQQAPHVVSDVAVQTTPERSPNEALVNMHDSVATAEDEFEDETDYACVNVESWVSDSVERGSGGLPPRAPPSRTVGDTRATTSSHEPDTHSEERAGSPPLARLTTETAAYPPPALAPQDFVKAVNAMPGGDSATTRADMRVFVQQMKINREKLLETGVYDEVHPVIREMNEKIRIYENFLDTQFT